MIHKALCVLLLLVVPGCSLLMPSDPAEVAPTAVPALAPLPRGFAYSLVVDFNDGAGAATANDGSGLPSNTVAGGVSIVAILRGIPWVGAFIFGADAAKDIAKNAVSKGGGSGEGPVTEGVLIAVVNCGRAKTIKWIPVRVEELKPEPVVVPPIK